MISRIILANDILEVEYFKLLSKFQTHTHDLIKNGEFCNKNQTNRNIFLKKNNSQKRGKAGLIECYNIIVNKFFTENEKDLLEKNLKRFSIDKTKLIYDISIKNLEVVGCSYSTKCFKYYTGCAYTLKYDKNLPIFYSNPKIQFKKLYTLEEIVEKMPYECKNYFDSGLKCVKLNDDLLDEKIKQTRDFFKFLNLTQKEKAILIGTILKEFNDFDSLFL